MKDSFSHRIIEWYLKNKRPLPWRELNDPYRIWLSEVILQQTRINQGLPYYQKFIEKYPQIEVLASAEEKEVLRAWQGLGYYTRARNMLKCAKMVVNEYGSQFPNQYRELLKLPGIGEYTAAAIASLAFNQPVPVVDGNVYRVLSRIFGIKMEINSKKSYQHFYHIASDLMDNKRPGNFNQALMEFGSLQCIPSNPDCTTCLFFESCYARLNNAIQEFPVKKRKFKPKTRYFDFLVYNFQGKILMEQRTGDDIWRGLFEFYLKENKKKERVEDILNHDLSKNGILVKDIFECKHRLTHQLIEARFIELEIMKKSKFKEILQSTELKAYSYKEASELPKPILIARYLEANKI